MPAGEDRSYSGNAVSTPLTASVSNVATSIPITASTGWPDGTGGPFFIQIDSETIKCSSRTGLTLNVQTTPVTGRGWEGTTAASHTVGAEVRHVFTATDAEDANEHISDTTLDNHTQYLTVARHDVSGRHGFGILPTAGTPSTSLVGDTATSGSSNNVARVDHKHAREGFGSPVSAGPVNADGTAITVARSDHKHAGGVPILTSATRPSTPIDGETIVESDGNRMVQYTGTRWIRGPHFTSTGRTGVAIGRLAGYSIPDAGPSSYIIPYDAKQIDTDGFAPTPDGTTSTTITIPAGANLEGLYIAQLYLIWASIFSARSYIEIVQFDGTNIFQHRAITTGDDRASCVALIDVLPGNTIQMAAWQNSGAPVAITGYMYFYRLYI